MLNDKTQSAGLIWTLIAAAAALNGCAVSTGEHELTGSSDDAAQRPPGDPERPKVVPFEHHHICYEDAPLLYSNGSVAKIRITQRCRANDGACAINGTIWPGPVKGESKTTVEYSVPTADYTATASFAFADGSTQSCSYTVGTLQRASPGAQLVGYTTDGSGLVTTGVWARRSTASEHGQTPDGQYGTAQTVRVPEDFVEVGGGVVGVPDAAFIVRSWLDNGYWRTMTASNSTPVDHDNDTHVIGLKVEGLPTLGTMLQEASALSSSNATPQAQPRAQATLPASSIALGGGGYGYAPPPAGSLNPNQQYFTASMPGVSGTSCPDPRLCSLVQMTSFSVATKDHRVSAPGVALSELYSLPLDVTINGSAYHFEGSVVQGTSPVAAQPSVVVKGAAGYALTGVGAFVDWQQGTNPQGNLLWKLQPRPDVLGVEAASTEHGAPSPAAVTGYAIGIKLVPGHS